MICRPHKVLERQYQLQAQKRHEERLKLDYHKQTARYFAREAALARQFNSWVNQESSNYRELLEKRKNDELLYKRREKLKKLLAEDENIYSHELDLQKHKRQRSSQTLSLEQLRLNLLEKKTEHSLYHPSSSRKLQARIFSPTASLCTLSDLRVPAAGSAASNEQTHYQTNHQVGFRPVTSNRYFPNLFLNLLSFNSKICRLESAVQPN